MTGPDDLSSYSFEQLMAELERTVERMASGALGIEEVTDLYERARHLHALATERLAAVEARIARLAADDEAG